jgi:pyruvate carboxylase subunit B
VKKAQGVDISRSFCGLNDHRNLELSVKYAKEAGMISQASLSITHSPVHTVDYYMDVVKHIVDYGTDEICLKDMAGIGRPATLGELVRQIKKKYPGIVVDYHGHSGPGLSVASMLEVARAGADYIDVAMEPLSWGTIHPDVIAVRAIMDDAGFDVPKINMDAYMKVRSLTQSFIDDFLGYFIDPRNRQVSSLLLNSGLPGGMMGSMMADLKGVHQGINSSLKKQGLPELTEDELVVKLFQEVETIWPVLGYPPLVTPFSQYVKNVALMNIIQMTSGKERYGMIDNNTWDMILGKAGKLPGELGSEIVSLAKKLGKEFYTGNPQDAYPDELPSFRAEMKKNGWDPGQDEEELFELAMHDRQYRDYKSGVAKTRFEAELAKAKEQESMAGNAKTVVTVAAPSAKPAAAAKDDPSVKSLTSPAKGKIYYNLYGEQTEPAKQGDLVNAGERICYIQTNSYIDEIKCPWEGEVAEVIVAQGADVNKGDILFKIREQKRKPRKKKQA